MLMDRDCIQDLQRMYTLFSRVNALQSLREALGSHILSKLQGMNMDEEKYEELVSSVIKFHVTIDTIWKKSFSKDLEFGKAIEGAFKHFINLNQANSPPLVFSLVIK